MSWQPFRWCQLCCNLLSYHFLLYAVLTWGVLSRVLLFVTPRTIARQAPLFMGFPRQEYWSRLPFASPGDLPHPGIKTSFPALAGEFFTIKPCLTPKIRSMASEIRIRVLLSPWEFGDPEGYMQSTSWEMLGWRSTSWNQDHQEKYQ